MTRLTPDQQWWSPQELAESGLPDLPSTRQGVDALCKRLAWRTDPHLARRRAGRGGGWEYSWRLLPLRAQTALLKAAAAPRDEAPAPMERGEAWAWFEGLPEKPKASARSRLAILQQVEALEPPLGKNLAVETVARQAQIASRTIWNWFGMVESVDAADRLPYLAPRHRAAAPKRAKAQASDEFYTLLKGLYLRLEGPGFSHCWRDAMKICKGSGLEGLTERTARRWLDANVPMLDQVFAREGLSGLRRRFPPQIRDRSTMAALQMVNADCHKIDVFVWWPGVKNPVRPQLIVFQDIYSGKILSWAIDLNPNKVAVMQAFMKMLKDYGIPQHCLFDNGMEFANKDMTGGAQHRFRFKLAEEEPIGVLGMLGIGMSFATVAHGQAKPIERAFKDFAEDIALDPRFAGAYVGNHIDAKPENYMSKAIDLNYFVDVVEEGIHEHNARPGRRSHTAQGRSFDETFAESYQRTPIRQAKEEQLRLCLMAMYVRKLHQNNGQITLYKNSYWSEWMSEIAGQTVTARFNPEDLHEGAYLYSMTGEYLGFAACRQKSHFKDIASARALARENSRRLKEARARLSDLRPLSIGQIAKRLDALPKPQPSPLEAVVVQLDRLNQIELRKKGGGLIQAALPVPDTSRDEELTVLQVDFAPKPEPVQQDPEVARFWRLLDIENRMAAGEAIPAEDAEFWGRLHTHPVYLAQRDLFDRHGAQAIG
ncbi:transposase domain-containing protein [Frigidibacter oleivorans]|uniref:transposase domain-containing protein n=1 Tax=Frigidibacter oleivorans TaxID=2487129 RepID=UPI000F8F0CFE|nr:transposase domain-containing protein [Frigidibacter oleivorans]